MTPVTAAIRLGATPLSIDEHGVPRLLRGGPALVAPDATTAARMHVERLAPAWGVKPGAMPAMTALGEVAMPGGTIVRLRQLIDGIPIDPAQGGELRVMVGADGSLLGASGKVVGTNTPHPSVASFAIDEATAVARAVSDKYKTAFAPAALAVKSQATDGSRILGGTSGQLQVSMSRARQIWYADGARGNALRAAYTVEYEVSDPASTVSEMFRDVVAADDGSVLKRTPLTQDVAFNYRVFAEPGGESHPFDGPLVDTTPHPTGIPNTVPPPAFVAPNLVAVDGLNHPAGKIVPDPWLAAAATETNGNNVDAYTDIVPPNGLTFGDFHATITSTRTFDRVFDPALSATGSQAQQMSGITSLFYLVNWLHDFWYDAGFTEAAGNAQNSNFGRGGEDRDALLAEAQDNANGGSRNNANMSTPSDGLPPRMQVFVWDGKDDRFLLISGRRPLTGPGSFGVRNATVTAEVVLATDGTAPASDGCEPLVAPVTGKIVLVDRGTCTFKTKALNIQNAGGAAVVIANNAPSLFPPQLGDDVNLPVAITVPVISIQQTEGATIKAELAAGPVTATVQRNVAPDAEGTLDATVIAHENGHYVHHRLTQCNTMLCGAMSEGWGDFAGLLVSARAGDNFNGAFATGVYSTQGGAGDSVFYGIRRAPYTINKAINGLSFRHMAVGVPLPPAPFNAGNTATNNEVHAAGEVWASMLWEGYAALQQQPGAVFEDVRLRMRKYVVGGLLLAPTDATPTETRDSILAVAHAASPTDHDVLAAAYARRGFGTCAVSPPRDSVDFIGIVETTDVKGRLEVGTPTVQLINNCDGDDVLDAGETARISVTITNTGAAPLQGAVVALTSTTPGLHIANATTAIGAVAAFGAANAEFDIALDDSLAGAAAGELHFELTASNSCNGSVTIPLPLRLNTDDIAASSASDSFDAGSTVWTTGGSLDAWEHARKTPLDGLFVGHDLAEPGDATLTSPLVTVGTGPFTIAFTHRFAFEAGGGVARDGGVIEYSLDDGTTWQDISALTNPGYNATLTGAPETTGNPLAGRPAFGNTSPAFPATNVVTLNLGTKLAGKQLRLRFHVGSDTGAGASGWEIDNVAFRGITSTPFPILVADSGTCGVTPPDGGVPAPDGGVPPQDGGTGSGGGPTTDAGHGHGHDHDHGGHGHGHGHGGGVYGCQVGGSGSAGAGALLGLLAVLLRRRRP